MSKRRLAGLLISLVVILVLTMFFKAGHFGVISSLILKIRLNKSIALFVGSFSIGFSTYVLQKFTKNNIIDSSFFGIGAFNIFILVLVYYFFSSSVDINTVYKIWMPFLSIVASITISLFLSATVLRGGKARGKNTILAGIIINYLFMAVAYMFIKWLDPNDASAILDLSIGAINEGYSSWVMVMLFSIQVATVIWYQVIYKKVNVTNINVQLAEKLGNNTKRINIQQIIIVGSNVAIGFSLLGGISFVGIIAANIAMFISKKTRWSAIIAGLSAALVTAFAYLIMNGFVNLYYPIGITSSLITIPYFIYKIVRSKNG